MDIEGIDNGYVDMNYIYFYTDNREVLSASLSVTT